MICCHKRALVLENVSGNEYDTPTVIQIDPTRTTQHNCASRFGYPSESSGLHPHHLPDDFEKPPSYDEAVGRPPNSRG